MKGDKHQLGSRQGQRQLQSYKKRKHSITPRIKVEQTPLTTDNYVEGHDGVWNTFFPQPFITSFRSINFKTVEERGGPLNYAESKRQEAMDAARNYPEILEAENEANSHENEESRRTARRKVNNKRSHLVMHAGRTSYMSVLKEIFRAMYVRATIALVEYNRLKQRNDRREETLATLEHLLRDI